MSYQAPPMSSSGAPYYPGPAAPPGSGTPNALPFAAPSSNVYSSQLMAPDAGAYSYSTDDYSSLNAEDISGGYGQQNYGGTPATTNGIGQAQAQAQNPQALSVAPVFPTTAIGAAGQPGLGVPMSNGYPGISPATPPSSGNPSPMYYAPIAPPRSPNPAAEPYVPPLPTADDTGGSYDSDSDVSSLQAGGTTKDPNDPYDFSKTMQNRVAENTSHRAQAILASFCLDILALGFIVASTMGVVTWNKTLAWISFDDATVDGIPRIDVFAGIWGQCLTGGVGGNLENCRMWFEDEWGARNFGKPWMFAMPILTMVSMFCLTVIPIFAFFLTTGRRSFFFIAMSNILANAFWIAAFTMMILLINRMDSLLFPYVGRSYGVGFYFGCVATGLMALSMIVKIVGFVKYPRTHEEMMMSLTQKNRAAMLAAAQTMPAVMVGGKALTQEEAARQQVAAQYNAMNGQANQGLSDHVYDGGDGWSGAPAPSRTAVPPAAAPVAPGPAPAPAPAAAAGLTAAAVVASMDAHPVAQPSPAQPIQPQQVQQTSVSTSQVTLQQTPQPTPPQQSSRSTAPAPVQQTLGAPQYAATSASPPAPAQAPLKSATSSNATYSTPPQPGPAPMAVNISPMAAAAKPQPPKPSPSAQSAAAYLASLPPSTKAQIEGQIQTQLGQYAQPIADYVRAQYPNATQDQLLQAYTYYMSTYREQVEGQYADWVRGQGGGR